LIVGGVLGAVAIALLLSDAGGRSPVFLLLLANLAGLGCSACLIVGAAQQGSDRG
jgi:hypothetical protein